MILPNINIEAQLYDDGNVVPRVQIKRRFRNEKPEFLSQHQIAKAYSSMMAELIRQRQDLVKEQYEEKEHSIKLEIGQKIKNIEEVLEKAGVVM